MTGGYGVKVYITKEDRELDRKEIKRLYGLSWAQADTARKNGYFYRLSEEQLQSKREQLRDWHASLGHRVKDKPKPEPSPDENKGEKNESCGICGRAHCSHTGEGFDMTAYGRMAVLEDRIAAIDREIALWNKQQLQRRSVLR